MNAAETEAALPTLRLLTCGSVDDGKSTLIGRLLYEKKLIFDDQLSALERDSKKFGTTGDDDRLRAAGRRARSRARAGHHHRRRLSLLRHRAALVHRRRYAGPRAIYPQHGDRRLQRRPRDRARRRAQGAADADPSPFDHHIAARRAPRRARGQQDRSRRLQRDGLSPRSSADYRKFAETARLPLADRAADLGPLRRQCLVAQRDARPGTQGRHLLDHLETIEVEEDRRSAPFRLPVQWINRPHLDFRGFAGTIPSGRVARGDRSWSPDSGPQTTVERILVGDRGEVESRRSGRRGHADARRRDRHRARRRARRSPTSRPEVADQFTAHLIWMSADAMLPGRSYLLKIGATHDARLESPSSSTASTSTISTSWRRSISISTRSASATSRRPCRSPSTPIATIA